MFCISGAWKVAGDDSAGAKLVPDSDEGSSSFQEGRCFPRSLYHIGQAIHLVIHRFRAGCNLYCLTQMLTHHKATAA
jgi:hypothetical protein